MNHRALHGYTLDSHQRIFLPPQIIVEAVTDQMSTFVELNHSVLNDDKNFITGHSPHFPKLSHGVLNDTKLLCPSTSFPCSLVQLSSWHFKSVT